MASMIYVISDFNEIPFKVTRKENQISWNSKIKDQRRFFAFFLLCIVSLLFAAIILILISLICN
jgi:hypothetical protein